MLIIILRHPDVEVLGSKVGRRGLRSLGGNSVMETKISNDAVALNKRRFYLSFWFSRNLSCKPVGNRLCLIKLAMCLLLLSSGFA